jgi:hypothetical protein
MINEIRYYVRKKTERERERERKKKNTDGYVLSIQRLTIQVSPIIALKL